MPINRSPPGGDGTPYRSPIKSVSTESINMVVSRDIDHKWRTTNFVTPLQEPKRKRLEIDEARNLLIEEKMQNDIMEIKTSLSNAVKIIGELKREVEAVKKENGAIKEEVVMIRKQNITLLAEVTKMRKGGIEEGKENKTKENKDKNKKEKVYVPTFAEKVKELTPAIVVKANEQKSAETIMLDVKQNFSPKSSQVQNMRKTAKGDVLIECLTKEATEEFKKNVETKLGDKYTATIAGKRRPKVVVNGMEEKFSVEEIKKYLTSQNGLFFKNESDYNIVHVFSTKKNHGFKMELCPELFHAVMEQGRLAIGWNTCKVEEAFNVSRCYNCNAFNHQAKSCKATRLCPKCGQEHDISQCQAETEKCSNCVSANESLKLNLDINHAAWNASCMVLQRKILLDRRRINYGTAQE